MWVKPPPPIPSRQRLYIGLPKREIRGIKLRPPDLKNWWDTSHLQPSFHRTAWWACRGRKHGNYHHWIGAIFVAFTTNYMVKPQGSGWILKCCTLHITSKLHQKWYHHIVINLYGEIAPLYQLVSGCQPQIKLWKSGPWLPGWEQVHEAICPT